MSDRGAPDRITTLAQLRERYDAPPPLIERKVLPALDAHCRRFIARSPLVMVATADADGACDVSPRGDPPGFVAVLDDHRLLLPDRKGNNRLDALRNVLVNPHVGLCFIVPGIDDTLRVNGRASITTDRALLEPLAVRGVVPKAGLLVEVVEAFLHCGRAFKRGRVWDPDGFAQRGELPTLAEMLRDQTRPDAEEDRLLARSEQEPLY